MEIQKVETGIAEINPNTNVVVDEEYNLINEFQGTHISSKSKSKSKSKDDLEAELMQMVMEFDIHEETRELDEPVEHEKLSPEEQHKLCVEIQKENYNAIVNFMRYKNMRARQYPKFVRAMKRLGFNDIQAAAPGLDSLTAEQVLDEILKEDADYKSNPDCIMSWIAYDLRVYRAGRMPPYVMTEDFVREVHACGDKLLGVNADVSVVAADKIWELLDERTKAKWPLHAVRFYLTELRAVRAKTGDPTAMVMHKVYIPHLTDGKPRSFKEKLAYANYMKGIRRTKTGRWIFVQDLRSGFRSGSRAIRDAAARTRKSTDKLNLDRGLRKSFAPQPVFICRSERLAKMLQCEKAHLHLFWAALRRLGNKNPEALHKLITEERQQLLAEAAAFVAIAAAGGYLNDIHDAVDNINGNGLDSICCTLESVKLMLTLYNRWVLHPGWSFEQHEEMLKAIETLGGNPFDEKQVNPNTVLEVIVDVGDSCLDVEAVELHLVILRQVWKENPVDCSCYLKVPKLVTSKVF